MFTEPHLEHRSARPYIGIALTTSMQQAGKDITDHLHALGARLRSRHLAPAGAPFVRYREIEMPSRLLIEVGMPVASPAVGGGGAIADALPEGRYAVLVHTGSPDELVAANARLQQWAQRRGIRFHVEQRGAASIWAARIETSLGDPEGGTMPRTEIAYLVE